MSGINEVKARLRKNRFIYNLPPKIFDDFEALLADHDRLETECVKAEEAIRACAALKEWGPSTSEYLASRVAFLCNLYAGCVHALGLIADQRDALEAENAELARKAKCFDAMVEHGIKCCLDRIREKIYRTTNDPDAYVYFARDPMTAVEITVAALAARALENDAAVKSLEGK